MSNRTSKLIAATLLAAVAATSFAFTDARATNLPPWGQGVVLVPPAAKVEKVSLTVGDASAPAIRRGKIVDFAGGYASGTIIIVSRDHALYFVLGNGKAVKYRVATGKKGFEWTGSHKVSSKVKWPDWTPPAEMRKRRPELPPYMAGGPNNPWARAPSIWARASIAFMAPTSRPRSASRRPRAASACSMRMSLSSLAT